MEVGIIDQWYARGEFDMSSGTTRTYFPRPSRQSAMLWRSRESTQLQLPITASLTKNNSPNLFLNRQIFKERLKFFRLDRQRVSLPSSSLSIAPKVEQYTYKPLLKK